MRLLRAVALLGLVSCASSTDPEPKSDLAGTILYTRDDGNNWNLYSYNAETGERDPLLTTAGDDVYPVWFPDHDRIAFIAEQDSAGIYIMNANGSGITRVYSDTAPGTGIRDLSTLSIAPSGDKIAFTYQHWFLAVLDLADSSVELLRRGTEPSWSPDGQWIAITVPDGIGRVHPDGSGFELIIDSPGAREPSYSPDGQSMVYSRYDGHGDPLYLANADGTGGTPLTPTPVTGPGYQDLGASWSADSKWLVFQRDVMAECTAQVCLMAVPRAGGDTRRLTSGLRPSW